MSLFGCGIRQPLQRLRGLGTHAASAAEVMFWLTVFGIAGALIMAYLYARGISRPLKSVLRVKCGA